MGTILVTGNRGYVGSVLVDELTVNGWEVSGLDTDFYRDCELIPLPRTRLQLEKDIRQVESDVFSGYDAVIHLAALSNDPLGEISPALTEEINLHGTIRAAECAKKAGVSRFVYASSQSMYGIANTGSELDEDDSVKNPLTVYARTKWEAEQAIKTLADDHFTVVCLRPSTVFGASPRLRSDIVFNNLVGCAYTTGNIEIKSDGTPWRPVVHVRDVSMAFMAALAAPASLVNGRSYNVGIPDGNFQVKELAEAAAETVLGCRLSFTGEHTDNRTYKVGFSRILNELKEWYKPHWSLLDGGRELVSFYEATGFSEIDFRGSKTNRLPRLNQLLASGKLDSNLFWTAK